MRTFLIIWLGQFVSLLGSELTNFAITLWAWEITGQATPLSLIMVCTQIPKLLVSPFAGIWVDRYSRKFLMLLGDLVAGLSTIALLMLFLMDQLQVWHLYISGAINGLFGYIQGLAYSASLSLIVTEKNYARATALGSVQMSGSYVLAPALAGALYATTGLTGVLSIDIVTFGMAITSLVLVKIPQPSEQPTKPKTSWSSLAFGLQYLWVRPSLMALLGFWIINSLIGSTIFAILPAMVLARSNNNPLIWGTLLAFFGMGGLLGGLTISVSGGPKRRIHGVLIASALWKFGIIVLALAQQTVTKIGTALVCGFCSPFPESASQAIWMSKVEPEVQGRVFATQFLLTQLSSPIGYAIAGPLADHFFEPAMQPDGALVSLFGSMFGTGLGAGMALQVSIFALCGMLIAIGGYGNRLLRSV
ncbi:MFS transporter [Acaryochloris sp. CCMEE 5410]|uniref:MFS transporter n=1 Tax=Acaryochloris sp. CCMEE 5410 TaxID=310037 RepID=UPI0002483847|nr:MFS transporter [Acaryochloris sp. CCMEE 5410]KAI9135048.1 MFS transporter [Acaryochloris sp. CCMEE 5410]